MLRVTRRRKLAPDTVLKRMYCEALPQKGDTVIVEDESRLGEDHEDRIVVATVTAIEFVQERNVLVAPAIGWFKMSVTVYAREHGD